MMQFGSTMSKATTKSQKERAPHRQSVSLTDEQHRLLSEIAQQNKVSVAWVIREAIERLLKDDAPLLHVRKG